MGKFIYSVTSISLAFQLVPLGAYAAFHEVLQDRRENARQERQDQREQFKGKVEKRRETLKQELKSGKEAVTGEAKKLREAMKAEVEKKKKEFGEKQKVLKEELKAKREKFQGETAKRREELKKKVGEKRAENVEKFFGNMIEKFRAAAERLKKSANDIEMRIKKAEANGRDMTEANKKLLSAREKIGEVEKTLEEARTKYSEYVNALNHPDVSSKAAFNRVKRAVGILEKKIKEAQRALVEALTTMKGVGKKEGQATTTPSTSTTATTTSQ